MARFLNTAASALLGVALATLALSSPAMAADAAAGAKTFRQACGVCHATSGTTAGVGPSLAGVVGRKAGTQAAFASRYSPAMKAAGFVWTAEKLEHYITNPAAVVPGNHMPYAGTHDDAVSTSVAAYLATLK